MELIQSLPNKLYLKLRSHAANRMGDDIEIFRAVGDDDFALWKTIKISEFEKELQSGLTIVDSKLAYGDEVFYQARSTKDDDVFFSEELYFLNEKGPLAPKEINAQVRENRVEISWKAGKNFSHVIVYRRDIMADAPLEMVSNLVGDDSWTDNKVDPNGVYTYQVVAASVKDSLVFYGAFSEPLYVSVENDKEL